MILYTSEGTEPARFRHLKTKIRRTKIEERFLLVTDESGLKHLGGARGVEGLEALCTFCSESPSVQFLDQNNCLEAEHGCK